jgi:hypothetical protein
VVCAIAEILWAAGDLKVFLENLQIISKKRGQLKQVRVIMNPLRESPAGIALTRCSMAPRLRCMLTLSAGYHCNGAKGDDFPR